MKERFSFVLSISLIILLISGCGGGGVVKPSAPMNFKAERSWEKSGTELSQKVVLSWDEVTNAQTYKIYRQVEGESVPKWLKDVSAPSKSYIDNLSTDLFHLDIDYFVSAVVSGMEGEKAKASTSALPPPAPF